MSVDAQRLQDILTYINTMWSGPLQIIVATFFLHMNLGNSVFAGIGFLILLVPINGLIAKKAHALEVRVFRISSCSFIDFEHFLPVYVYVFV